MKTLFPPELKTWRAEHPNAILLDVREHEEREISVLPDDVHIPLGEIPARFGELERDKDLMVYCRSGRRSEQVALWLESQGFVSVWNLETGINGYARTVDPRLPQY